MENKELRAISVEDALLTTDGGLERLLTLIQRWWEGRTLSAMAQAHNLSRQRVHAILARVGCTRRLWWRARRDRPDSGRRASGGSVAEARIILTSRFSMCLTVRQRCAFAWQAAGLTSVDTAKRMAIRPQNVRRLLALGRWRMDCLMESGAKKHERIDASALDHCDVGDLLKTESPPVPAQAAPVVDAHVPAAAQVEAAPADVPPQPQANDVAEQPPAEPMPPAEAAPVMSDTVPALPGDAAPRAQPHEPIATEPAAEQTRDVYVERHGDPAGPDSAQGTPARKPRLRLSELQRVKRR